MFKEQEKSEYLQALRHSTEHVLHTAMQLLYPRLKKVMGPAIEDGFYFDSDLDEKISPEDFPKIEAKMQEIIDVDLPLTHKEITIKEARKIFKDNEYKLAWLEEIAGREEKVNIYEMGNEGKEFYDMDLCKGPHVKSTGEIKAFKLLNVAGAYYKGNENNKMLTRIYGTAFDSKEELRAHLKMLEEAENRNHRKIGKDLEIFAVFPEIGAGLPIWLPNGFAMRKAIESYLLDLDRSYGYQHVITPHIHKSEMFEKSGHLQFYKESMYSPMDIEGKEYYLKPMNCPAGMMVYNMKPRSYRDLPIKLGEFGTVYRYEKSGELHGLQRVRGFTQNDAHIFCTPEQLEAQFLEVFEMLTKFYKAVGFDKYKLRLSLSDPEKDKYKVCGTPQEWQWAENKLREFVKKANKAGIESYEAMGEAVFYGPKLDIQAINVFGKEDSISTIQIDFNLAEKFDINYIDENGEKKRPFVIHRALVGSFERFFAFLIEFYAGNFPVWFAPQQVEIIPIGEKHVEYAQKLAQELVENGFRTKVNSKNETMQAKIREAQLQKVPYMLIVGDREVATGQVSVRLRTEENKGSMDFKEFKAKLAETVLTKSLELW